MNLIKIGPQQYIHILDTNLNITRLMTGPVTYLCKEHEKTIQSTPVKMHIVPRQHYCIIENPVILKENKIDAELDKHGQAKLRHGQREIRFEQQEPFPLYPGERMVGDKVHQLKIIGNNEALKVRAICDCKDINGVNRKAGEEYLLRGPTTYLPNVNEEIVDTIKAIIIKAHQALKLCAVIDFVDRDGKSRRSGEEWLVQKEGAFIVDPYEEIVEKIDATILDDTSAVEVRAIKKFTGDDGVERKKGERWLLTKEDTPLYIPPPEVKIEKVVSITVLKSNEFAEISDYQNEDGVNQMGQRKQIVGPATFFLKPGEKLMCLEPSKVLLPEEALYVMATEEFEDTVVAADQIKTVTRKTGSKWYVYGPQSYIRPIHVNILSTHKAIVSLEDWNIHIFSPFYLFMAALIFLYVFIKIIF